MEKVEKQLKEILQNPNIKKRFLVNFKEPEVINGVQFFGNNLLPAWVSLYTGPTRKDLLRVYVEWDNGFTTVSAPDTLNFKEIK